MPRTGDNYTLPYSPVVSGTPIESVEYNGTLADIATDLNTPRPVVAGGSGASTVDGALDNLSAEKFKQVVTNWDATVWRAGSFYAATTAIGSAPVASHAFAGIVYYRNATDLMIEATDVTDPVNPARYMRIQTAGVWGSWILAPGSTPSTGDYTFRTTTTFPPAAGEVRLNNATQNSATEIFISHTTAQGVDNTGAIQTAIKPGVEIYIQDKDESGKYKIFFATGSLVLSGSDFRILAQLKTAGTDIVDEQRVLVSASDVAVPRKNYIINGAMMVSQENGAGALNTSGRYPVDQFFLNWFGTTGVISYGQVGNSPSGSNRISFTVSTLDASVASGDGAGIITRIEGLRVVDLKYGTATAKTTTLQFGVRAPQGTYSIVFYNGKPGSDRGYVAEYVIAAGENNTDVIKSVTIPGDTSGTWAIDNTIGLEIRWGLMAGSGAAAAPNAWGVINPTASTNQFNFMQTLGNIFHLFDVSLTEGTVAPPFVVPDYASELAACQRYYVKSTACSGGFSSTATANFGTLVSFPVYMRAAPTVAASGGTLSNATAFTADKPSPLNFRTHATPTAGANWFNDDFIFTAAARL